MHFFREILAQINYRFLFWSSILGAVLAFNTNLNKGVYWTILIMAGGLFSYYIYALIGRIFFGSYFDKEKDQTAINDRITILYLILSTLIILLISQEKYAAVFLLASVTLISLVVVVISYFTIKSKRPK